jgi:hypothetical protein
MIPEGLPVTISLIEENLCVLVHFGGDYAINGLSRWYVRLQSSLSLRVEAHTCILLGNPHDQARTCQTGKTETRPF